MQTKKMYHFCKLYHLLEPKTFTIFYNFYNFHNFFNVYNVYNFQV